MRTVIIIMTIILLSSPVLAQSMEREMSLSFDGEIDYISESGTNAGQSVLVVEGTGKGGFVQNTSGGVDTFKHQSYGETEGVEVISGVKYYTEDYYVTQMTGDAEWWDSYYAEINNFPLLEIETDSGVVGSMARRIDMKNNGLWIDERFSVTGAAWVIDQLKFAPVDE